MKISEMLLLLFYKYRPICYYGFTLFLYVLFSTEFMDINITHQLNSTDFSAMNQPMPAYMKSAILSAAQPDKPRHDQPRSAPLRLNDPNHAYYFIWIVLLSIFVTFLVVVQVVKLIYCVIRKRKLRNQKSDNDNYLLKNTL